MWSIDGNADRIGQGCFSRKTFNTSSKELPLREASTSTRISTHRSTSFATVTSSLAFCKYRICLAVVSRSQSRASGRMWLQSSYKHEQSCEFSFKSFRKHSIWYVPMFRSLKANQKIFLAHAQKLYAVYWINNVRAIPFHFLTCQHSLRPRLTCSKQVNYTTNNSYVARWRALFESLQCLSVCLHVHLVRTTYSVHVCHLLIRDCTATCTVHVHVQNRIHLSSGVNDSLLFLMGLYCFG